MFIGTYRCLLIQLLYMPGGSPVKWTGGSCCICLHFCKATFFWNDQEMSRRNKINVKKENDLFKGRKCQYFLHQVSSRKLTNWDEDTTITLRA